MPKESRQKCPKNWLVATVQAYDNAALHLREQYRRSKSKYEQPWWSAGLPDRSCRVLDVGAGTGLDATWLVERGHEVIAVEPSAGMRWAAEENESNCQVRWIRGA